MDNNFYRDDGTPSGSTLNLTAEDLAMFAGFGIPPEMLAEAGIRRVTDAEARAEFGIRFAASADLSGIFFPYISYVTGRRSTGRLKRDRPEVDTNGNIKNKYICPWGDNRHLYILPDAAQKLKRPDMPVVLVEAEKSALAITAWAERTGTNLVAVAMGGCWGWRGRIGKTEAPDGERVDVLGPLDDLHVFDGRKIYIMLDANAATNPKVAAAKAALVAELRKRECETLICDLPVTENVNGPDDLIAVAGDFAMAEVFATARPPARGRKLAVMPSPPTTPPAPPLSADEAAVLTSDLLARVVEWIGRYVIVTPEQAMISAVWVLHSHAIDAVEWTPYLHITGPDKAIGKTLLMDVLAAVASNPRTASGATPAALVRIVDKYQPTLFLDEMDASTNGNRELAEAQRGILDAGFKRGGVFFKCVGKDNEVRPFNAFGPKCFAGIGDLPGTISSRSIDVEMRRKLRSEYIERYRSRIVAQLSAPIRADLERWGAGVIDLLKSIEPAPIDALPDRANDVAEILLAIAQLAGGDWLQRLTAALLAVYGSAAADDTSAGVMLLADIRDIFGERGGDHIPSKVLAAALCEIEGRPWAEWSRGRGLSANNLARQLAEYHVHPQTIRLGSETAKGYRRADFADAWDRYCAGGDFLTVTTAQPASILGKTAFCNRNSGDRVTDAKSGPDPHGYCTVTDVTDAHPGYTQAREPETDFDAAQNEEGLRL